MSFVANVNEDNVESIVKNDGKLGVQTNLRIPQKLGIP